MFEQVDEQNLDATGFLDLIPQCYENSSVAYVYRTDTSVYNVSVAICAPSFFVNCEVLGES